MEYISDELTDVTIKLDVFQTYQFDFHYLRSLIEREHANSDIAGDNTIPEGIEKGEFIINKKETFSGLGRCVYIVTAKKDVDFGDVVAGTEVAGVYYPRNILWLF